MEHNIALKTDELQLRAPVWMDPKHLTLIKKQVAAIQYGSYIKGKKKGSKTKQGNDKYIIQESGSLRDEER